MEDKRFPESILTRMKTGETILVAMYSCTHIDTILSVKSMYAAELVGPRSSKVIIFCWVKLKGCSFDDDFLSDLYLSWCDNINGKFFRLIFLLNYFKFKDELCNVIQSRECIKKKILFHSILKHFQCIEFAE